MTETAQRRLAAIFAADVVGYSRLMEIDQAGTLGRLRAVRHDILSPTVAKFDGRIFKLTGDGAFAEFASATNAVMAAVAIQRAMAAMNAALPEPRQVVLRIGVNLGDVVVEDDDLYGDGVNVAARLEGLAEPGGICISGNVHELVANDPELAFDDLGEKSVKNIDRLIHCYSVRLGGGATPGAPPPIRRSPRPRRVRLLAIAGAALLFCAAIAGYFAMRPSPTDPNAADSHAGAPHATHRSGPPLVAVLPFGDSAAAGDSAYFIAGVTEELINALGQFDEVRVLSRNATFRLDPAAVEPRRLREELGADYIVEGSIRRQDARVLIIARLIDSATSAVLWSERYDGEMTDLFVLQDKIARQISANVTSNVVSEEAARVATTSFPDLSAYDLVLRARALNASGGCKENRQRRELLGRAVALDPDYASAHALMAEAIVSQIVLGCTEFADAAQRDAEEHARRSIALAPTRPDGHRALARLASLTNDRAILASSLPRALSINPSDPATLAMWGVYELYSGEFDDAVEALEAAYRYDPSLDPIYQFELALAYYMSHRHEDALLLANQAIAAYPDFYLIRLVAAVASERLGRSDERARHMAAIQPVAPLVDFRGVTFSFADPEDANYWVEGLQLVGLAVQN